MFTDRFIKVPVDLYDIKQAEMVGYNKETNEGASFCMINPFDITYYRPAADDERNLTETCIFLKNGESFYAKLSVKDFEVMLNKTIL